MAKKRAKRVFKQIIHSYGLYWHTDDVFWGVQNNTGAIWGRGARRDKGSGIVNFRDQIGVYVLYDQYRSIYVGQAGFGKQKQNLLMRLRKHRVDDLADRWNRFSWFGTRWVKSLGKLSSPAGSSHPSADIVLDQLEAILITAIEPGLNRQGGKWRKAKRYKQVRDPRLGEANEQMLKQLIRHQNLEEKKKLDASWEQLL